MKCLRCAIRSADPENGLCFKCSLEAANEE